MKLGIKIFLFLLLSVQGAGQDTAIIISPAMTIQGLFPRYKLIELHKLDGWIFKKGSDTAWARKDIDVTDWKKLKPTQLSKKFADKDGKLECWLRLKIKPDTAFQHTNFGFQAQAWAAMDIYINGVLFRSYGNTGANGKPFREYNPHKKLPADFTMERGKEYVIAIHFVDFVSPFPPYALKSKDWLNFLLPLELPEMKEDSLNFISRRNGYETVWLSVNIIICLLFWLLVFQNHEEKNLKFIALVSALITLLWFFTVFGRSSRVSFIADSLSSLAVLFLSPLTIISVILLIARIFNRKASLLLKVLLSAIFIVAVCQLFFEFDQSIIVQVVLAGLVVVYYVVTSWKELKGAQWAVVIGIILALSFGLIPLIPRLQISYSTSLFLTTGLYLSYPLSLLTYVAIRFREIIKDVRENSRQVVLLSEEKRQQALNQQKILQEEVNRQTAELRNTLDNLKSTQAQLIQQEKMASLGELTAGIAHEIQNPLNFVNNFSEVNGELIEELQSERAKGRSERDDALEGEIINDIKTNLQKINHHGKRADAIVKGMLQHSKTSTGVKEPTDINKLADEYLRLAYHGMRAKDKEFNADIKTDFDESIEKINVVPQDIGRVLLNLYNNAFYAVNERCKAEGVRLKAESNPYIPTVTLVTKKLNDKIEIKVSDNGNGIPQKIVDKIFQPFFTTKPTGQSTGLGLSLAYDIIKAHGGEIKVETNEGKGTEFTILLPTTRNDKK